MRHNEANLPVLRVYASAGAHRDLLATWFAGC